MRLAGGGLENNYWWVPSEAPAPRAGGWGVGGGVADVLLGTRMVAWALDSVDRFYMALWVRWGGHAALLGVLGGMPKGKFQCCDKDFCN